MRCLAALLLLSACIPSRLALEEPVVFEVSLESGVYAAGAMQGIGGTLVNRSREMCARPVRVVVE